nr:hypothetical protein [Tanacetum cinerariifolium]
KWEVFQGSKLSAVCQLTWGRPLPGGSTIHPLVTIGEECLLVILSLVFQLSRLPFAVVEPTGLDVPAERGMSVEDNARPVKAEDVVDVEREGVKLLGVGVDGPKGSLIVGEFIFLGVCSREPGVEACVFWEGLVVLLQEEVAGDSLAKVLYERMGWMVLQLLMSG